MTKFHSILNEMSPDELPELTESTPPRGLAKRVKSRILRGESAKKVHSFGFFRPVMTAFVMIAAITTTVALLRNFDDRIGVGSNPSDETTLMADGRPYAIQGESMLSLVGTYERDGLTFIRFRLECPEPEYEFICYENIRMTKSGRGESLLSGFIRYGEDYCYTLSQGAPISKAKEALLAGDFLMSKEDWSDGGFNLDFEVKEIPAGELTFKIGQLYSADFKDEDQLTAEHEQTAESLDHGSIITDVRPLELLTSPIVEDLELTFTLIEETEETELEFVDGVVESGLVRVSVNGVTQRSNRLYLDIRIETDLPQGEFLMHRGIELWVEGERVFELISNDGDRILPAIYAGDIFAFRDEFSDGGFNISLPLNSGNIPEGAATLKLGGLFTASLEGATVNDLKLYELHESELSVDFMLALPSTYGKYASVAETDTFTFGIVDVQNFHEFDSPIEQMILFAELLSDSDLGEITYENVTLTCHPYTEEEAISEPIAIDPTSWRDGRYVPIFNLDPEKVVGGQTILKIGAIKADGELIGENLSLEFNLIDPRLTNNR